MTKIGIIEDDSRDAIRRYSHLVNTNEVHVQLTYLAGGMHATGKYELEDLVEAGFKPELIYINPISSKKPVRKLPVDLDVYFVDGLNGWYVAYVEKYGKEKTHVISGSPAIIEDAQQRGISAGSSYESKEFIQNILNRISP